MQSGGKKQEIMKSQWIEYDGGTVGRGKASGGLARGAVGHKAVRKFRLGVIWDPIPRVLSIGCSMLPTLCLHLFFHMYRLSVLEIF